MRHTEDLTKPRELPDQARAEEQYGDRASDEIIKNYYVKLDYRKARFACQEILIQMPVCFSCQYPGLS